MKFGAQQKEKLEIKNRRKVVEVNNTRTKTVLYSQSLYLNHLSKIWFAF